MSCLYINGQSEMIASTEVVVSSKNFETLLNLSVETLSLISVIICMISGGKHLSGEMRSNQKR